VEAFILNTTFLPLSHQFHPVYLAAAYLNWTRQYLSEKPWTVLPEIIGGHAWFAYVDPAIDQAQLAFVTNVLDDDYKFFEALLSQE
jgi:hypothetical protein